MINRSKNEIIAVILKTASSNRGTLKARIMYEGYLSWAQLKEYLSLVLKNDLIKYQERDRTFIITEKGIRFLNMHNELNKLITTRKQIENKTTPTLTQTNNASTSDHNLLNPEARQNMTIPSDSEEQQPIILQSPAKKQQLLHNNVGID
jgi:predicted transcriptional regulator